MTIKASDIKLNPELEECTRLEELFGQKMTVKDSHMIQVGKFPCAIIETEEHGKVSSMSEVIIDQLEKFKEKGLGKGETAEVKAEQAKGKQYYQFVDVE